MALTGYQPIRNTPGMSDVIDITRNEVRALVGCRALGPFHGAGELAEHLSCSYRSAHWVLARLEMKGLVTIDPWAYHGERVNGTQGRYPYRYELTDKGEKLAEILQP